MSVAQISAPPLAGVLLGRGLLAEWAFVAAAAAAAGVALGRWGSARVPAPASSH
jgi:hypothetical protein